MSQAKIINDPIYGFIKLPEGIGFKLIEHRWFQRLRHIKQLGLAYFVYPGATHTRFSHSLGSYHLITLAINEILKKGFEITKEEAEAVSLAMLLHDIGHIAFSHLLEGVLIENVSHEELTNAFLHHFYNNYKHSSLCLAIDIYNKKYPKSFLSQLISGELDMDRLDYLKRDCFYTGVVEGAVGVDRIIKMLTVYQNKLAVEEKGVYSIEKFLIARRLMYWQVYLHKTVISADVILSLIFKRIKELFKEKKIKVPELLMFFLANKFTYNDLIENKEIINKLSEVDDAEVWTWIKMWSYSSDPILSYLCKCLIERKLFKIKMQPYKFDKEIVQKIEQIAKKIFKINNKEVAYFVVTDEATNKTYSPTDFNINILTKENKIIDISFASDIFNLKILSKKVTKHYLCYPIEIANVLKSMKLS